MAYSKPITQVKVFFFRASPVGLVTLDVFGQASIALTYCHFNLDDPRVSGESAVSASKTRALEK